MIKIILNPDLERVKEIKNKIKEKGGYCPCKLLKMMIQNVCVKSLGSKKKENATAGFISKYQRCDMVVSNVKVYDLEESLIASGYPMRVKLEEKKLAKRICVEQKV